MWTVGGDVIIGGKRIYRPELRKFELVLLVSLSI